VGPGNHVLDGSPDPPIEGAIFCGKGHPFVKYRDALRSSVQKRLNRSRCCLGCGLGWAQGIVLDGGLEVLRDVAMPSNFWLAMCYNFGCMIARDALFYFRGGFSGSSCPMKT